MKVDIEHILYLKSELKKINSVDINDIVFMENGEVVEISDEIIEDFAFTGLNNVDIITSGFYKDGFKKGNTMSKYPEPDCNNVACVECGAFLDCDFADKYTHDELKYIFNIAPADIEVMKKNGKVK